MAQGFEVTVTLSSVRLVPSDLQPCSRTRAESLHAPLPSIAGDRPKNLQLLDATLATILLPLFAHFFFFPNIYDEYASCDFDRIMCFGYVYPCAYALRFRVYPLLGRCCSTVLMLGDTGSTYVRNFSRQGVSQNNYSPDCKNTALLTSSSGGPGRFRKL